MDKKKNLRHKHIKMCFASIWLSNNTHVCCIYTQKKGIFIICVVDCLAAWQGAAWNPTPILRCRQTSRTKLESSTWRVKGQVRSCYMVSVPGSKPDTEPVGEWTKRDWPAVLCQPRELVCHLMWLLFIITCLKHHQTQNKKRFQENSCLIHCHWYWKQLQEIK